MAIRAAGQGSESEMKSCVFALLAIASSATAFMVPTMSEGRRASTRVERRDVLSGFAGAAALVAGSTFTKPANAASTVPEEGTPAPDFTLPSSEGKDVSLGDLTGTGKMTVLYFYPASFTKGCTLEAKAFQRDLDAYNALNAQIVGVSVDPVTKNAEFQQSCGLGFTLLSDAGAKVSEAYGSALEVPFIGRFANRQTYIISPQGKVVKVFTDVESRVTRHSAEVLDALKSLKST